MPDMPNVPPADDSIPLAAAPVQPSVAPTPPVAAAPTAVAVPVGRAAVPPATPPRRGGSRVLRGCLVVVLILIVCMIVGVLLIPTLLSMGPAASVAQKAINQKIRGHVAVGGLSVGWFSPIALSNVTLKGPAGHTIATIPSVQTQLSLLDVMKNWHDIKTINIHIATLKLMRTNSGKLNIQRALAAKPGAAQAPQPAQPGQPANNTQSTTTLPVLYGQINTTIDQLTWSAPNTPAVTLAHAKANIGLDTRGNTPVKIALKTGVQTPNSAPGTITTNGTVALFKNQHIAPMATDNCNLSIAMKSIALGALDPMLAAKHISLSGLLNGGLHVIQTAPGQGSVKGLFSIGALKAAGAALHGDHPSFGTVQIPVRATWADNLIHVRNVAIKNALINLSARGVAPQSFAAMSANHPMAKGTALTVAGNIALASLAAQLPNTLHLQKGMRLTSGAATLHGSMASVAGAPRIHFSLLTQNIAGNLHGKAVRLQPLAARGVLEEIHRRLEPSQLNLSMPATGPQTGKTLWIAVAPANGAPGYNANLKLHLAALEAQAGQFVNLTGKQARGQLIGHVRFDTANAADETFSGGVQATNLSLIGFGGRDIAQKAATLNITNGHMNSLGGLRAISCVINCQSDFAGLGNSPIALVKQADGTWGVRRASIHVKQVSLAGAVKLLQPAFLTSRKLTLAGMMRNSVLTFSYLNKSLDLSKALVTIDNLAVGSTNPALSADTFREPSLSLRAAVTGELGPQTSLLITGANLSTADHAIAFNAGKPLRYVKGPNGLKRFVGQFLYAGASLPALRPLLVDLGYLAPADGLQGFASLNGTIIARPRQGAVNTLIKVDGYQLTTPAAAQALPPTNIIVKLIGNCMTAKKEFIATSPCLLEEHAVQGPGHDAMAFNKGSRLAWGPGVPMNAHGTLSYDLARLASLLGPKLPAGTVMVGKRTEPFTLTGSLSAAPGLAKIRNLNLAPMAIGFDKISYSGLNMSKGKIMLALANGVAAIGRTAIPANGGMLNLGGHVDLMKTPAVYTLNKPLALARNLRLNGKLGAGPLKFLPLNWGAGKGQRNFVKMDGLLNLDIHSASLPLSSAQLKKTGTLQGSLSIQKLTADTPLVALIQKAALPFIGAKGKQLRLADSGLRKTAFNLKKGKVYYKNLKLLMASFGMNFSGWASLNKKVNMQVQITGLGLSVPVPLAISGSMSAPHVALSGKGLSLKHTVPGLLNGVQGFLNKHKKTGATTQKNTRKNSGGNNIPGIINGLQGMLNRKK